ncbi:adenine deaminase [Rhodohalobacter sp. 614A]|uniref:adenine deaminase n=1 Tax=Rhodohalobacter sp. 614A TaxID=2908649 RepID=UPI001F28DE50|nr:adenine deaminase [Rhodohalobacter sp. 614A]
MKTVQGKIVDPVSRRIFNGEIEIKDGKISDVRETDGVPDQYIMPGLIDSHIHIESSMLIPSEFARLAVRHGTVATVSDPHEIANVCGKKGVEYMIKNGKKVPLKFYFGVPSCVPATTFETAGAELDKEDVEKLLQRDDIHYLSEMMNWPGVLNDDPDVLAKIDAALKLGKPIDGHAPGLKGEKAKKYAAAEISTDHECFTIEEAIDKLEAGMLIIIREGSAAKNYNALVKLFDTYPDKLMFCSDDKHPDDLIQGHINELVVRTLSHGYDLFDILHASSVLPIRHYGLKVGLLQKGDSADFIIVDQPESMKVKETWIDGEPVFQDGKVLFSKVNARKINHFTSHKITPEDVILKSDNENQPLIVAEDGQLVTKKEIAKLSIQNGIVQPDPDRDILKIAVVNRYEKKPPAIAFIKNFGLKNGAIASSVAHDSHNIIAVGSSDEFICKAVNMIMEQKGGISAVSDEKEDILPLPIAGIMSDEKGEDVAAGYERLSKMSKTMGSSLNAPFMLISFMALLVIPSLKLSDKGLFDGETFEFVKQ